MSGDLWMLDTNTVSDLIKHKDPSTTTRLAQHDIRTVCISAVTEAELVYGLAKNPSATHLKTLVYAFLVRVTSLPWNSRVASTYGELRASIESQGLSLGNLDLMIAAHAVSARATLVTSDNGIKQIDGFVSVEDWR